MERPRAQVIPLPPVVRAESEPSIRVDVKRQPASPALPGTRTRHLVLPCPLLPHLGIGPFDGADLVLRELEVASPLITTRENMQALLDGFGWRPFRSEWDYAGTYRRIVQEVFADECRRAGLA